MNTMMFVENETEAKIVEELFTKIRQTLDEGKDHKKARCFDEAAFIDGRGEAFSDYPNENCPNAAATGAGDFPYGGFVRIPYGALVYVYRKVEGGYGVYDAYSFGYRGNFGVKKGLEGDLAGLCNAGDDFFPNI